MPELPEVETMRRGIEPIVGACVADVQFPRCELKPIQLKPDRPAFRRALRQRRIIAVDRLGKRILLRLDSAAAVVVEPRMTGLLLLADPPNETHLRVIWQLNTSDHPRLAFWDRRGLGTVRLMSDREQQIALGPDRIGPDALAISSEVLRAQLQTSRRAIKVALLDQRAIAGIGNLYASEILYVARINPRSPCCRLTRREWTALTDAIHDVLREAVLYEGSTLSDGTYRNALNVQGSYQNHHRVYARAQLPCPRCPDVLVERFVQAQRATFWCPSCQRSRRRLAL